MKTLLLGVFGSMLMSLAGARAETQVLQKFSFDMDELVYPRIYNQYGVSISLMSRVKIVPRVSSVAGQIFTSEVSLVNVDTHAAIAHDLMGVQSPLRVC